MPTSCRLARMLPVGTIRHDPMSVACRLVVIAVLALWMLAAAAPSASAAKRKGDPTELWKEFPLDPVVTPTPPRRAGESTTRGRVRVVSQDDGGSTLSTIVLMVLAGGVGAMGVMLVRGRTRSSPEETRRCGGGARRAVAAGHAAAGQVTLGQVGRGDAAAVGASTRDAAAFAAAPGAHALVAPQATTCDAGASGAREPRTPCPEACCSRAPAPRRAAPERPAPRRAARERPVPRRPPAPRPAQESRSREITGTAPRGAAVAPDGTGRCRDIVPHPALARLHQEAVLRRILRPRFLGRASRPSSA